MSAQSHTPENFLRPALIQLAMAVLLPVIGLLTIDLLIVHPLARNDLIGASLAVILIVIPKIIGLLWIAIRVLRYTEEHYRKFGIAMVKTSLLACLFLAVLVISVNAIDAIQVIIFSQNSKVSDGQKRAPDYRLGADMVKKEYTIEGIIDYGITSDFRLLLEQNPGGTRVVLASQGGSIYEGRGLAALIQNHGFDTHVIDECSSACTLVFMGGQRRSLAASAKLGFHQYSMEYLNQHQVSPFHDLAKEQERDSEFLFTRGTSKEFMARIFDRHHADIWYPDHATLLGAGVIHSD